MAAASNPPINASSIERGYLVPSDKEANPDSRIPLHFNPVSLTYSVEASQQQNNRPNRTNQSQYVAQYSSKLSFDAVFDNSDNGNDIRITTYKIARCVEPAPQSGTKDSGKGAPPLLVFQWGSFRFTGILTQYRETIEYFSKEGVPLRSTVGLTLTQQDKTLEMGAGPAHTPTQPSRVPTSAGDSAVSAATRGGNPGAMRQLAAQNNLASLRFTNGTPLEIGGGGTVSAQAGLVGGGSASVSASWSSGGGADASANWNTSGSGSLFGAQASAGVSASEGAFAGVSAGGSAGVSGGASLDASAMLGGSITSDVGVDAGAAFSLGGAAQMETGAGLSADVGAKVSWKDLLQFVED